MGDNTASPRKQNHTNLGSLYYKGSILHSAHLGGVHPFNKLTVAFCQSSL